MAALVTFDTLTQLMLARKLFIGSTTYAGIAIPAYNATAQVFGLWNPAGSNVNVRLVKITLGIATAGTEAVAALGLSMVTNAGNALAGSGGPITAFTQTNTLPALLGDGAGAAAAPSAARFTLSATTIAPTFAYSIALSETAGSATTTAAGMAVQWMEHEFPGTGLAPGTYIGLGGSVAPGSTFQVSLTWAEFAVS